MSAAITPKISVPFFFTPVEYNGCYYVDGGLTKNFSLGDFNAETSFGMSIINRGSNNLNSIRGYLQGLISITIDCISLNSIKEANKYNVKYNYIEISCKNRNPVDFGIGKEAVNFFLEDGMTEAKKYYRNFEIRNVIDDLINKCIEINDKKK